MRSMCNTTSPEDRKSFSEMFAAINESESDQILKRLSDIFGVEMSALEPYRSGLEQINSPCHYQSDGGMEAIDVIENFGLNFNLGNVVKYLLRAGKKGNSTLTDLQKALWYLQREVNAKEQKDY